MCMLTAQIKRAKDGCLSIDIFMCPMKYKKLGSIGVGSSLLTCSRFVCISHVLIFLVDYGFPYSFETYQLGLSAMKQYFSITTNQLQPAYQP